MTLQDRGDRSPIRIGALAPLTAPGWIEAGQHLLAGLELGVRDVNDVGGIDGRPIELIVRDTAADPARAAAAVDELARLGVAALAGEYHSVVARAIAAKADTLAIPYLCSSAVLDVLTEAPTNWVARLAPPQSRGWRVYADFLLDAGHRRIAVIVEPSVYWASGVRILRDHLAAQGGSVIEFDLTAIAPNLLCDELLDCGATALLVLVGYPEPAVSVVRAVRSDPRHIGMLIGAPAGQPELGEWARLLGAQGAAVPFLRYLPKRLAPLGEHVVTALHEQLGEAPSFVALEGYDTIVTLSKVLRTRGAEKGSADGLWPLVEVEGDARKNSFFPGPGNQRLAMGPGADPGRGSRSRRARSLPAPPHQLSFPNDGMRLSAEASRSRLTPVDPSARLAYAGDVLAELFLERWRPGHELEAKAIVEHGEAA